MQLKNTSKGKPNGCVSPTIGIASPRVSDFLYPHWREIQTLRNTGAFATSRISPNAQKSPVPGYTNQMLYGAQLRIHSQHGYPQLSVCVIQPSNADLNNAQIDMKTKGMGVTKRNQPSPAPKKTKVAPVVELF